MKHFKKAYLEITNICNKSCAFCVKTSRTNQFMPLEDVDKFIQEIAVVSDHLYLHVLGEPLLHPELAKILTRCAQQNMKVHLATNATLLHQNIDLLLSAKALHRIMISLHDADTIGEACQIIDDVHALYMRRAAEYPLIEFRLWAKDNHDGAGFNEHVAQYLASVFCKNTMTGVADGRTLSIEARKRGITVADHVYLHVSTPFEWPRIDDVAVSENDCFCMGLRDQVAVLVDGTVVPCCMDFDGIMKLGNLKEQSLTEIIQSEMALDLIDGFSKREARLSLCKVCKFRELRF